MELLYHLIQKFVTPLEVDPGIYCAIRAGVVMGSIILSVFILFPGEPFELRPNKIVNRPTLPKNDDEKQDDTRSFPTTFALVLNKGFLISLFVGGFLLLNQLYGLSLIQAIKFYFPREAAVFGI
jgi:hypothetical protein